MNEKVLRSEFNDVHTIVTTVTFITTMTSKIQNGIIETNRQYVLTNLSILESAESSKLTALFEFITFAEHLR